MDSDDVMLPDRLGRQVAYFDSKQGVALLGGGIVLVDERGTEIDREPGRLHLDFLVRNELTHATVMMRTEPFRALGGYRLDQSEDYDLWLRFDERYGVAALPDPVISYRLHPGQFSVTALERQALGFLCVREAAIARRRGEQDPLAGVDRSTTRASARHLAQQLDDTIVSTRTGRRRDPGRGGDAAASRRGRRVAGAPPRRSSFGAREGSRNGPRATGGWATRCASSPPTLGAMTSVLQRSRPTSLEARRWLASGVSRAWPRRATRRGAGADRRGGRGADRRRPGASLTGTA
jgi:hypothetical protein